MPNIAGLIASRVIKNYADVFAYLETFKVPILEAASELLIVPDSEIWGLYFKTTKTAVLYYKEREESKIQGMSFRLDFEIPKINVDLERDLATLVAGYFTRQYYSDRHPGIDYQPLTVSYVPEHEQGVIVLCTYNNNIENVHILHWDQRATTFNNFNEIPDGDPLYAAY